MKPPFLCLETRTNMAAVTSWETENRVSSNGFQLGIVIYYHDFTITSAPCEAVIYVECETIILPLSETVT